MTERERETDVEKAEGKEFFLFLWVACSLVRRCMQQGEKKERVGMTARLKFLLTRDDKQCGRRSQCIYLPLRLLHLLY